MDKKRISQLKRTISYSIWSNFLSFLNKNPTHYEIMKHVQDLLDSKGAFRSITSSAASREALDLLMGKIKED